MQTSWVLSNYAENSNFANRKLNVFSDRISIIYLRLHLIKW